MEIDLLRHARNKQGRSDLSRYPDRHRVESQGFARVESQDLKRSRRVAERNLDQATTVCMIFILKIKIDDMNKHYDVLGTQEIRLREIHTVR